MARIRTIKPEFPQSESMGRVTRDGRLLFVMLWTICDDAGRARANSRMLASLLFPYDEDAPKLLPKWLGELEREECIIIYSVGGNAYLQITHWTEHQKIDKPSGSKIPPPPSKMLKPSMAKSREDVPKSRDNVENGRDAYTGTLEASRDSRERSSEDLDQGPGKEGTSTKGPVQAARAKKNAEETKTQPIERVCEALGVTLTEDARRLNWPSLLATMLDEGLDLDGDILPACTEAKSRGIANLIWVRKRAEGQRASRGVQADQQSNTQSEEARKEMFEWLKRYAMDGKWIKNESGNGVWKDCWDLGPPPHDPKTLIAETDLALVKGACEMRATKSAASNPSQLSSHLSAETKSLGAE